MKEKENKKKETRNVSKSEEISHSGVKKLKSQYNESENI